MPTASPLMTYISDNLDDMPVNVDTNDIARGILYLLVSYGVEVETAQAILKSCSDNYLSILEESQNPPQYVGHG